MGPYDIANIWIEGFDVVVNKPKSAAYRAPGVPAAAFAMETALDILCDKLGMDPLQLRLLNSAKEGTRARMARSGRALALWKCCKRPRTIPTMRHHSPGHIGGVG